jgi:hypothetical protein
MSIFGSIVNAIFHKGAAPAATAPGSGSAGTAASKDTTTGARAAPAAGGTPTAGGAATTTARAAPAATGTPTAGGAPASGKPISRQDVEAMIAQIAARSDEDYDWKRSIVDLMKLLKLDSSLSARKQLAQELGYKGELTGSAEMNTWLHQQVMTKLAESGGVVPDSLKHA